MKYNHWILFCLLLSAATVSTAGDIQVSCQPDLRIYLDDTFMGTSNAMEDGLCLAKVAPGAHTIRVEKDGFLPKNIRIEERKYSIDRLLATNSQDLVDINIRLDIRHKASTVAMAKPRCPRRVARSYD